MSFVNVAPDGLSAAAKSLKSVGAALNSANKTAAASTVGVTAPAADQVSAAVIAVFGKHASEFQMLGAQTVAFHEQFVGALNRGASAYQQAEVANAQRTAADGANTPGQAMMGHPLVGPAAAAPPAVAAGSSPVVGEAPRVGHVVDPPVISGETAREAVQLWLGGTVTPTGGILVNSVPSLAAPSIGCCFGLVGSISASLVAAQGGGPAFTGTFGGGVLARTLGSLMRAPGTAVGTVSLGQSPLAWLLPAPAESVSGHSGTGVSASPGRVFGPLRPATASVTTPDVRQAPSV